MGAIVVDSSALLAILLLEKDLIDIKNIIADASEVLLSAATYTEAAIVIDSYEKNHQKGYDLDDLLETISAKIVPFDRAQAIEARAAYKKFGKGNHPAKLNMGDCFSYALAKQLGLPLLYKGNDFDKTDIISAL